MQKDSAKNLIQDTLQSSFNKERFIYLTKNILNHIEDAPFVYKGNFIFDDFADSIKTVERIGKYKDPEEKLIDILIVRLQKETSLERARTKQRNFVAKYLKGSRGGVLKDAALAAFVSPNGDDWRFSLVKMEYKFNQKGRVEEEFTPARRYSFLVGKNENSHTAQSRLLPLLLNDETNPSLKELEDVFSVEKVTKEFFEKYRDLYFDAKKALDKIVEKNKTVKDGFCKKNIDTVDFVKKLLGQIVFLYFLQKKGWFGVPRGKDWGEGDKKFLRTLFLKAEQENKNFFNDYLEPLFYQALRYDRSADDDYFSQFDCKIPFLNGGLFDPMGDYDWVNTDILLPNDLFSNDRKTKEGDTGNGILDVFDRYNFTVKEDEPLEKEVAIDPEMLGKVFENLLEVKDRKSKGTYYTPREIVHYMCQESLANYLTTELSSVIPSEVKNFKEDIEILIKYGETSIEHDVIYIEKKSQDTDYKGRYDKAKLPNSIEQNAKLIDEKLASIRVCDPAVGSGAFPVGMMKEIIRTRNALTPHIDKDGERTPYNFKRQAVQNCLYGVDIDPGAVEIAKLRLWLSLIVDEEEREIIKPLPNLDYKIVCGNSLLSVEKYLFNAALFDKLEELKPLYFKETSASKKQEYKEKIDELISQITNGHKDFDFEVYFSEVFHERKGFDVVIANPPYVKERDNKIVFESIRKTKLGKRWHQGKMDFWYFFLHRAIDIVKKSGSISFITSRYWLNSAGAKKLIHRVKDELSFVAFVDIGKLKVFDEVAGQHMVAVYIKDKDHDEFVYKRLENDLSDIEKKEDTDNLHLKELNNSAIYSNQDEILIEGGRHQFENVVRLGEVCDVSQGVVEAPDRISKKALESASIKNVQVGEGVFVLTRNELDSLCLNREEKKVIKKYLDAGNVFRYGIKQGAEKNLIYSDKHVKEQIKSNAHFTHLKNHLDRFRKLITSSNAPYGLHRPRQSKYFTHPKIIFKNMFAKPEFTYDTSEFFFGFSFSAITEKDKNYDLKYVLAILNSSFALSWYQKRCKKRGAGFDVGVQKIREFPIKKILCEHQELFIDLVDKILAITKDDDHLENSAKQDKVREYEKEIDQLVYKLYGLTLEEIAIIEGKKK